MNIQASPKNRSSRMKRNRQARILMLFCGSARNWRHLVMMMAWIISTAAVQVPAFTGSRPQARQEADRADQQQDHQRGRKPVLRELAQQLVIEGRTRAGGGGQPVARLAHMLHRGTPALCRRSVGRRGDIALIARGVHVLGVLAPIIRAKFPQKP